MKPVYLKMKAFGSYVESEINFRDFNQGLFLISGETGAGKTMIFDAIAFALYGKASSRDREPAQMHCDRVPLSEDIQVKLIFMQNDQEYIVERSIHFSIKRGTADQISATKPGATLKEPDGTVLEGHDSVTNRCVEILGMNVDQFRKIVMLAQGEFREFLKADSDKKNEILGKLFDNTAYRRYQDMLEGAKDILEKQRNENRSRFLGLISTGFPENQIPAEERVLYMPESPDCIGNLEKLVEKDRENLEELEKQKTAILRDLEKLNQIRGEVERVNKDLNELKELRDHQKNLSEKEEEIRELENRVNTVKVILYTVKPKIDARRKAECDLNDAVTTVGKLQKQLDENEKTLKNAKELAEGDTEIKEQEKQLGEKLHHLEGQRQSYHELSERIAEKKNADQAADQARKKLNEAELKRQLLEDTQTDAAQKLEELKNIDYEAETAAEEEKKAKDALNQFTGRDGIIETVKSIRQDEASFAGEKGRLTELTEKAGEAEKNHHDLYQRFISGQAGLLADSLRHEIEKEGKACCPVCGSTHTHTDEAHFAIRSDDTPTEAEVGNAKKEYDQAERNRKAQDERVKMLHDALNQRKNDLLRSADPLFPGKNWETVSDDPFLSDAEESLRAKAKSAQMQLKEAKEKQRTRNNLLQQQRENEKSINQIMKDIDSIQKEELDAKNQLASAESAIKTLKNILSFDSAEEAEQQIRAWKEQQKKLQILIKKHADAEAEAQSAYDTVRGSLEEKKKEIPALQTALGTAQEEMEESLQNNRFADAEDALNILDRIGTDDRERWIADSSAEINQYGNDRVNTAEKIQKLSRDTEGKDYTDIQELEDRISEKREAQRTAESEYSKSKNLLEDHQNILKKAREYHDALTSTEGAWNRLNELGTLAAGYSGTGGKLSFDRYVMGAVFRDILEMANRRIDIMSGGRYELVHKMDAQRKDGKAGLEIEVLDTFIGKARASSLLSGGEGFYASLSLALGLSDVVQMHAGGKSLDALFIDEGFGTLSMDVLEKAIRVLDQLSSGNRLVGIISHVDKLDECIPQKILVTCDEKGSHVCPELQ